MSGKTIAGLAMGAFTGTLDFSANNPSMTFANAVAPNFSITGTGTRTLNLGSGTFTLAGVANSWDATVTTNLTFNAGTATICLCTPINFNHQAFVGGGLTYPNVIVGSRTNGSQVNLSGGGGSNIITNLSVTAPVWLTFSSATTTQITNLTLSATSSNPANFGGGSTSASILQLNAPATVAWAAISNITVTTSSLTAINSVNMGGNSGITFASTPGGNGAPPMIGGL